MKILKPTLAVMIFAILLNCKNEKKQEDIVQNENVKVEEKTENDGVMIIPITHGTLVIETSEDVIYVDPTGGSEAFESQKAPSLVLITDIHGDHLNIETLEALNLNDVTIVAPKAVTDKIPSTVSKKIKTVNNNETYLHNNIDIKAIPMYNLREEALKFHTKGRGNGYVLDVDDERIYISGDTEDIPEMRTLESIDKALVCMNLPYTMPVESAADAVLDFKPKVVIPYHYRGTEGLSDVEKFKSLVNKENDNIEVQLLNWY